MEECEVNQIFAKSSGYFHNEADILRYKYANTLVEDVEQPEITYLLHCKVFDALPNQQTVVHAVHDTIFASSKHRDNNVLFFIDAAKYMTAAGHVVKQTFPRFSQITCVAHVLHMMTSQLLQ